MAIAIAIGHRLQYPDRGMAGQVILIVDPAIPLRVKPGNVPRVCQSCSPSMRRPVVHQYKTHHIPLDDAARCVVADSILSIMENLGYVDGVEIAERYTQMGMIPPGDRFTYVNKIVGGSPVRLGLGPRGKATTLEGKDVGTRGKPIFVIQDGPTVT